MVSLVLILLSGQIVTAGALAGIVLQMRHNQTKSALVKVPTDDQ